MATLYKHQWQNIRNMRMLMSAFFSSILFFGLFFVFNTVRAESIQEFNSTISVNIDSSVLIEENITYDFEGAEKHGIFRTIPLKNSLNNPIIIKNVYVSDNGGNEYNFTQDISNEELTIKIGDVDKLVSGIKEYHIAYRVYGLIGYYEDYDEIYWNVTGNDWLVPIKKVQARVFLPENVKLENLKNSCYVGIYGSNISCQIDLINNDWVSFFYDSILNPEEGMTIATGFNKNIVDQYIQPETTFFSYYSIVLLPIIIFIVSFLVWRKYGKDPKGYSTIIAQYEPPKDIKPTLAGVIVSEKRNYDLGMIAGIIYLAEQGFLKIYKEEKKWLLGKIDYQVELIKEDVSSLGKIEISILNLFFDKLIFGEKLVLSELNSNLTKRLDFTFKYHNVRREIDEEIKNMGLMDENSAKLQLKYFLMSFPVIIISGLIISNKGQASTLEVFSMIASLCIMMFFGVIMGKKTKKGSEVKDHLLGFQKFLSVVEKDRLDFHNAPEKNPKKFMEFLPYAIALGVEKKWAKHFDEIYIQQQSWYIGGASSSFIASDFTSEISQFSTSFSSVSVSSGSGGSSGGGSSGGGGGGGGGGSW
jgi:uncharacterized membrane protein